MDLFYGFDLGDAESAVSRLKKNSTQTPQVLDVAGRKSFITAYAVSNSGELKIGENACYQADAVKRKIRFKSRFLTDSAVPQDVKRFAAGVLGELYGNGDLVKEEDTCFYIGCPAGWNKNARERYRQIFENVGYPPAKIVSESRAALVSACQSRHLQVGYDILSKPVLVVDIGSSTTDFAYVCGGKEVDIQTAGEVVLGGGIMDEILLEECIEASSRKEEIRDIFSKSEAWKNYCEFAARRLKEKYFSDEDYWVSNPCSESVLICFDKPIHLELSLDAKRADLLLNKNVEKLEGKSFRQVFLSSLENLKKQISGEMPELVFLTGGVSKLPAIRDWCEESFPDSVIINGSEPEFSVSRGLAWCGKIDEELREFKFELENLRKSSVVENLVKDRIYDLYQLIVETLVEPLIREVAVPVFEQWRKGEIDKLSATDTKMQTAMEHFLRSEEARKLLVKPITDWLRPIADEMEAYTVPICLKHHVPYSALSLRSYLADTDINVRIDAKSVFGVEELTFLIESIISIVVGLICGGSGIALIASGIPGVLIGFVASFIVLTLGKSKMEQVILDADIPRPLRKLLPRNFFEAKIDSMIAKVKTNLQNSLENEKNDEITNRMVNEISEQIETCLTHMAEIVEIPLG